MWSATDAAIVQAAFLEHQAVGVPAGLGPQAVWPTAANVSRSAWGVYAVLLYV